MPEPPTEVLYTGENTYIDIKGIQKRETFLSEMTQGDCLEEASFKMHLEEWELSQGKWSQGWDLACDGDIALLRREEGESRRYGALNSKD